MAKLEHRSQQYEELWCLESIFYYEKPQGTMLNLQGNTEQPETFQYHNLQVKDANKKWIYIELRSVQHKMLQFS